MKRCYIMLFVILLLSGCSNNTSKNGSTKSTTSLISETTSSEKLLTEKASFPSIYAAYSQKHTDLRDKYGDAGITNNSGSLSLFGCSYLTGVCVVNLIDFNGDGVKDLLMIYSNGKYTGKNSNKISIPQAGSYEIEIWTYTNGELKQLLHEIFVGDFISFDTTYWDSDNCMATVYENKGGLPVIQLCSQNKNSLSYTNLYYFEGKVVTDKLTYSNKTFIKNGSNITEAVWNKSVSAYNKILMSVYLSSDSFTSTGLKSSGVDYNDTLKRSEQVLFALNNSKNAEFKVAEGSYIPLYLQELDKINRSYVNSDDEPNGYQYNLYDIDKNGSPELIVNNYYTFDVYTIVKGNVKHCGNFPFKDRSFYYNGKKGLISYGGRMGNYYIDKVTLNNTTITIKTIKQGETKDDYPKLSAFGLGDYKNTLTQFYAASPYLLYMYSDKK